MIMKARNLRIAICAVVLSAALGGVAAAGAPAAPQPLAPANGASVQVPFSISWAAVSDPDGVVAYNWQVSSSAGFAAIVLQDSTNGATQDTVSGLANGTYFWRVQAVSGAFVQGAWSAARSFTVTGAGAGSPGTPTLDPTLAYSTFHPMEVIRFHWSAVPGAASYVLEASKDPSFPILTRIKFDNIPDTDYGFAIAGSDQGTYSARVYAVTADGIKGVPSNVITFSVSYNNPIGPAPTIVSPVNGPSLTLPITLTWNHVPNPQPSGYEVQISRNSSFTSIEEDDPQLNGPSRTVLSLSAGTKFWRVRSFQGDASATTAAATAWSSTGTFTIPTAPARPVSVTLAKDPLFSGETTWVQIQLTSAVGAGGATIALASSNTSALPVPATIAMPANTAWTQFEMNQFGMKAGQVVAPTPVTITATLNSASASGQFTVMPPSLKTLTLSPGSISGGAQVGGIVMLNGQAPPAGAVVSLASNSAAVSPPATVTVAPGDFSISFPVQTNAVSVNTVATVTASWDGKTVQSQITVMPQQPPATLTLRPSSTVGLGGGSFGTVTVDAPGSADEIMQVTSSQPSIASVPNGVMVPGGSTTGGFNIFTSAVSVPTQVTISVSAGGVTKSAVLTVNPQAAALSSLVVSPASVAGGSGSTGTVTLTSAAPSGGALVSLSSGNAAAQVPSSVTIPAGASSAGFAITTSAVAANTGVSITSSYSGTTRSATLTVTSASAPAPATLQSVTLTPSTVTGGASSQGRVTLSAAAPSGGAVVSLSSNQGAARVPASVTVNAGSTSATFTVTTTAVTASTAAAISAVYSGVTRSATLTVSPQAAAGTATLTVTASGRSGERITSSPAGISVSVGGSGSAPFAAGTVITLTVSNGRDAVWSGACSSGGSKTKTCRFTLNGNATVSANVQ